MQIQYWIQYLNNYRFGILLQILFDFKGLLRESMVSTLHLKIHYFELQHSQKLHIENLRKIHISSYQTCIQLGVSWDSGVIWNSLPHPALGIPTPAKYKACQASAWLLEVTALPSFSSKDSTLLANRRFVQDMNIPLTYTALFKISFDCHREYIFLTYT